MLGGDHGVLSWGKMRKKDVCYYGKQMPLTGQACASLLGDSALRYSPPSRYQGTTHDQGNLNSFAILPK